MTSAIEFRGHSLNEAKLVTKFNFAFDVWLWIAIDLLSRKLSNNYEYILAYSREYGSQEGAEGGSASLENRFFLKDGHLFEKKLVFLGD